MYNNSLTLLTFREYLYLFYITLVGLIILNESVHRVLLRLVDTPLPHADGVCIDKSLYFVTESLWSDFTKMFHKKSREMETERMIYIIS